MNQSYSLSPCNQRHNSLLDIKNHDFHILIPFSEESIIKSTITTKL